MDIFDDLFKFNFFSILTVWKKFWIAQLSGILFSFLWPMNLIGSHVDSIFSVVFQVPFWGHPYLALIWLIHLFPLFHFDSAHRIVSEEKPPREENLSQDENY